MKTGLIVRADQGGLASLTWEVFIHLRPDRVLVVDLGHTARGGTTDLTMYDAWWCDKTVMDYHEPGFALQHFLNGIDLCYTAETPYQDAFFQLAKAARCATVLHAMPELFTPTSRAANTIWAPTEWELRRLPPRTIVMPVPVALERFVHRKRTRLDTAFVTTGEAMSDRSGWSIVQAALRDIAHPMRLLWRGGLNQDPTPKRVGKVTVEWLPPVTNYWEVIPPDTDLLLMPRRYGGLCLPYQEAAAMGIPSIMTKLSPQTGWIADDLLIPTLPNPRSLEMKGGPFAVHDCNPYEVAKRVNWLRDTPTRVEEASIVARAWAEEHSWDALLPVWETELWRAYDDGIPMRPRTR